MSLSTLGCRAITMSLTLDPFRLLLISLAGWLNQHQRDVIDYLEEENRVLREQLGNKRLGLNGDQRRRLAVKAKKLGGRVLQELKTLVTPETLLAWRHTRKQSQCGAAPHLALVVNWTYRRLTVHVICRVFAAGPGLGDAPVRNVETLVRWQQPPLLSQFPAIVHLHHHHEKAIPEFCFRSCRISVSGTTGKRWLLPPHSKVLRTPYAVIRLSINKNTLSHDSSKCLLRK